MPQILLKPNDGVTVTTNLYNVEQTDEKFITELYIYFYGLIARKL